ncbi:MAG: NAD(P)/FAD-dependent oxidoreductase [Pseudomonadota bacterium]
MDFQTDVIVIGAGVIGLACARALARAGHEVIVLEAEDLIATQTSSRNSEVIHAGHYYASGSLKAKLCVSGRRQLYHYLDTHGVAYRRCEKLVVATTDAEADGLVDLRDRAETNGVEGIALIDAAAARAMEPALSADVRAALHSPVTGIFDSHAYFLALQGDLEDAGGQIAFRTPLIRGASGRDGFALETGGDSPARIGARLVVNAAGYQAVDMARRLEGPHTADLPTAWFAKGSYFTIAGKVPFHRLIYPMATSASLGIHLTIDLGGQGKAGPDAEWLPEGATPPFDYRVDPARGERFYDAIRKYWPGLPDGALAPGYSGVRPKLVPPGAPSGDFRIEGPSSHGTAGLINLLGIESPGLTSSLAIAGHVSDLARDIL